MIKRTNNQEVTVTFKDFQITAVCSGYTDPGKCYGPPENCYPPESECEITEIEISDETGTPVEFESLTANQQEQIIERIEDKFFDSLYEYDYGD